MLWSAGRRDTSYMHYTGVTWQPSLAAAAHRRRRYGRPAIVLRPYVDVRHKLAEEGPQSSSPGGTGHRRPLRVFFVRRRPVRARPQAMPQGPPRRAGWVTFLTGAMWALCRRRDHPFVLIFSSQNRNKLGSSGWSRSSLRRGQAQLGAMSSELIQ